jgi:16S rRNA (uracil1498-N3)-methyltransferase
MRLHRFYINQTIEKGKDIRIENPELIHQWMKVFRLAGSDRVIIFDGSGMEYEGYFKILSKKEAVIFPDKENKIENIAKIDLHIFQSLIKKDNFEFVVEKCTEIGASAFHPIITERSDQAHSAWARQEKNIERLKKISTEASEQSGRGIIPAIFSPQSLEEAIAGFDGTLFVADIDGDLSIGEIISGKPEIKKGVIGILIGPEGGWTENERDIFEHKEIASFSFGKQVLRAETASIVASALVLLTR